MPTQIYMDGATRLPGVTTVINNLGWSKDGLIHWAWKLGKEGKDLNKARQGAADIGTLAHVLIEAHIHGDEIAFARALHDAPEEHRAPAKEAFGAAERWLRQSRGTIVMTEAWAVDQEYQAGFCIDALRIEEEGTLALLDWKAANGTYADHVIQLSAYTHFVERKLTEWFGTPIRLEGGAHLCRFAKDSGVFVHHNFPRSVLDVGWSVWTWLRAIHGARGALERLAK